MSKARTSKNSRTENKGSLGGKREYGACLFNTSDGIWSTRAKAVKKTSPQKDFGTFM